MNTRALFRWILSIVVAIALLGLLSLALNPPAQARPLARMTTTFDWPSVLSPCNASLQQCIDAAVVQPGDTIHIKPGVYTQSVTLAKPVSLVGDNRLITILQAWPGQRVLSATGNLTSSVVISGLTFRGGNVGGSVCPDACGGGILLSATARPALQNLTLADNAAAWQGGGLWSAGTPDLKLIDVSFISNTAGSDGGGLYTLGNVQLFNSSFERNTAGEDGGGVFVAVGSTLFASNSTFMKNAAVAGNGGGAAAGGPAVFTGGWLRENSALTGGGVQAAAWIVTGTELISNSAIYGGGGAAIIGLAQLQGGKLSGNSTSNGNGGGLMADALQAQFTIFLSNTATSGSIQYGGAAYIAAGPNDLDRVWFQRNEAQSSGGAIYAGGSITLNGVTMISNTAYQGQGGGAYLASFSTVLNGNYTDNFAAVGGGGLYALGLLVDGAQLDGNRTVGIGGGLYADGPVTLLNSALRDNSAGQRGGGVLANSDFGITNTIFLRNRGDSSGGGLYHQNVGNGRVVNSLFARNQGSESGAALVLAASPSTVDIVHTTIADQPRNGDIGINNQTASLNISNTIIAGHATGINATSFVQQGYLLYFDNGNPILGSFNTSGPIITGTDPLFADVLHDDYHLRFNSPAINAGADAGINFDIDGQPRPIGPGFDLGFDEAGSSIQQMINATPPGGTVNIPPGVYTESLTLDKPVSLLGSGTGATIILAAPSDRVLTVTGNTILSATVIANLTLSGGLLSTGSCPAACGGGVLITNFAYPTFNSVFINSNEAFDGGGLYIQTGGARLIGSSIVGNTAFQSGGGAYVESASATLEQLGGTVGGNNAIDGAGVFVQEGSYTASGGVVYGNTASRWGGGLLIGSGGSIKTDALQIISNLASQQGGGLMVDVGQAVLQNSLLVSNTADAGGAVYVRDYTGTTVSLIGGKLESNSANSYGGGVYAAGTTFITGTRFFGNSAYDGSALEITGTSRTRLVNAFIGENPATGPFPSTNSSARFDSSGNSVVLHTTFGNATQPLTRALTVNNGVVTVTNTIVASYTNGLSWFGGRLAEDYNLFFATPVTASGSFSSGGHSLIGPDPLLKNPLIRDYHIKGLSPAVNRGANVGVRRDIDQDARPLGGGYDIGADEASVAGMAPGPDSGGQFTYTTTQNSTINLNVPPGAVSQTIPLYCSLIDTTTVQPPRRFKFAGVVFELDAALDPENVTPGSISFNVPVTLSVSYTDAELAAAGITNELTLQLYRFEPALSQWEPIGYRPGETQTLDADNHIITATVLGFSKFGRMGATNTFDIFLPLVFRNY